MTLSRPTLSFLLTLIAVLLTSACGSGSSSSGNNASAVIPPAGTPFAGNWSFNANITTVAGGTNTTVTQQSTVIVSGNGVGAIGSTDATGPLTINFNNTTVGYQTTILVINGVAGAAPCSLTITASGGIVGDLDNAAVSGSFISDSFICNGAAVTFSGNFTGSRTADAAPAMP